MADTASKPRSGGKGGRGIDGAVPAILVVGAVLTTVGFLLAFLYASPVHGATVGGVELIGGQMVSSMLLLSQKIFYFHMPVAIVSFLALVAGAAYSAMFLAKRDARFDTRAQVAMEIALLFVVCTMVTGEMWTRFEWGVWWTWEPRLTTYLILMLITIAYFVLRAAIDDPERRAAYSAVVAIVAFVDVPICFMVTRLIPSSIHPVVVREGGMSPDMALTLAVCLAGMLLVGLALYRMRLGQAELTQRVDRAQALLDELEEKGRRHDVSQAGFAAAPAASDEAAPSFADALKAMDAAGASPSSSSSTDTASSDDARDGGVFAERSTNR